jgi:hypothetical protein
MSKPQTITEPAREIPVFRTCDVLVVGGGPAGSAAAASAVQMGADTVLVERYGHLGGMSTGGFCLWIDRMTDWDGQQVIAGFANDLLDRMPGEGLLGPPANIWGSKDPQLVEYWQDRHAAFHGTITWSPTIDPEMLKIASFDLLAQRGTKLLLHSWAVTPVMEDQVVRGVIFESKAGRQAILAKVVIDATGDGDIFALAGSEFDTDVVEEDIHHMMNVAFLWDGTDMQRYLDFRREHAEEFRAIMQRGREFRVLDRPHVMPRNDMALFMGPRLSGYSCIDIEDLTAVEIESRQRMLTMLDFYRRHMPGFENARIMQTAPQMGVRHSRRLKGVTKMSRDDWMAGKIYDDEIALSPPPNPRHPNVSIPLGCMMPASRDNLLAAGRNLSCDAVTHIFMREVPNCWAMGQAAGVTAAVAINAGVRVRDVDVRQVQHELLKQGVPLHQEVGGSIRQEQTPEVS